MSKRSPSPASSQSATAAAAATAERTAATASSLDPKETFPSALHRTLADIEELTEKRAASQGQKDNETADGNASPSASPSTSAAAKQLEEKTKHINLKSITGWCDHGMAFKICDRRRFVDAVMPIWFMRLKHASFVRQLNLFGFKRIQKDGPDKQALCHESFVRGKPELAATIAKVKKRASTPPPAGGLAAAESEPNFQQLAEAQSAASSRTQRPALALPRAQSRRTQQTSPTETGDASEFKSQEEATAALAHPNSSGSLRDMLMPTLPPTGINNDGTWHARTWHASHSQPDNPPSPRDHNREHHHGHHPFRHHVEPEPLFPTMPSSLNVPAIANPHNLHHHQQIHQHVNQQHQHPHPLMGAQMWQPLDSTLSTMQQQQCQQQQHQQQQQQHQQQQLLTQAAGTTPFHSSPCHQSHCNHHQHHHLSSALQPSSAAAAAAAAADFWDMEPLRVFERHGGRGNASDDDLEEHHDDGENKNCRDS